MARLVRPIALVLTLAIGGLSLSACGSNGAVADARRACQNVAAALRLQHQSEKLGITAAQRAHLQQRALSVLLAATSAAAAATSVDGSWNPLMTTIGEAQRVPIVNLKASLTRLCQVANSSTPYL